MAGYQGMEARRIRARLAPVGERLGEFGNNESGISPRGWQSPPSVGVGSYCVHGDLNLLGAGDDALRKPVLHLSMT